MNIDQFRRTIRVFYPALVLERSLPIDERRRISRVLDYCIFAAAVVGGAALLTQTLPTGLGEELAALHTAAPFIIGMLLVLCASRLVFVAANAVFFSCYFFDEANTIKIGPGIPRPTLVHFETAFIALSAPRNNLTRGFAQTPFGRETCLRAGISLSDIDTLAVSHEFDFTTSDFGTLATKSDLSRPSEFTRLLTITDQALVSFLQSRGITREDFVAAARWIERDRKTRFAHMRWWSRDRLRELPSIGEEWAYGGAYSLRRFASEIAHTQNFKAADPAEPYNVEEVQLLETILSRTREANALLAGEDTATTFDVVARLGKRIAAGVSDETLRHKRILVLRSAELFAAFDNRTELERMVIKIFNEAASAGNIILFIENFPAFIEGAHVAGFDVMSVIEPYLRGNAIQLIASTNTEKFHEVAAREAGVAERFEQIFVKPLGTELIMRLLQDRAADLESGNTLVFTYQSLEEVMRSADQFFAYGIMPDKAFDLLAEVASHALSGETGTMTIVTRELVQSFITSKTGIPRGTVKPDERRKILGLKDALRKRVVGQDPAVEAVANALIRARSGLADVERPIGAFLFLGPTGVGKTETAKALAATYFGSERMMLRLDLSEFNTGDALDRLIGSYTDERPGVLASMLREHAYGVLLLDEFEKTRPEVHDLFLQIFDEGVFSDARGKRVSARNLIIIATSNAGSDLIWSYATKGEDVALKQRELVDAIIGRGIFKPELLNRFDEMVVFRPLDEQAIRAIAKLMLGELAERIRAKGYVLDQNDELIDILVREGYDPQFGARPMRRALADVIEQAVAERIVAGTAEQGTTIVLTRSDLARYGSKKIDNAL